jgi:hypothetical protein
MKKILLIVLLLILSTSFVLAQSSNLSGLTGVWKAETFLTERDDGLLVSPEAPYAFPYLGISEIKILDSGFIIFQFGASEFRAFYETRQFDYGNVHLICSFKNGEELVLKLVGIEGGWKYLIKIPSDSIMAEKGVSEDEEAESDMDAESASAEAIEADSEEDPEERLFAGVIRKRD